MTMAVWTEQEAAFVRGACANMTVETIAKRLGRTTKAVRQWCQHNGVYPTCEARECGWLTSGRAAKRLGVSPQWLTQLARAGRIRAKRVPGGRWWLFDLSELPMDEFAGMECAYVTQHAINQFRARINRWADDDTARRIIRLGLENPHSCKRKAREDGVPSLTVRVRNLVDGPHTYSFRVTLVPARFPGKPPVVVTTLHGTTGYSRGAKLPRRTETVPA